MEYIVSLMDKSLDTYIVTVTNKEQELTRCEELVIKYKSVINSFYMKHSSKESILFTMSEICLCFEQSIFCSINGFYNASMESLRKIVELTVFGICFDKDITAFQNWLSGNSEFGFTGRLNEVFNYPEITLWSSNSFYLLLKSDLKNIFGALSQYTHSNPTRWEHNTRDTWYIEYDEVKFNEWYEKFNLVVKYAITVLTLYSPDITNDACAEIIDNNILANINSHIERG